MRTAEEGAPVSPDTAKLIATRLGLSYIELIRPPAQPHSYSALPDSSSSSCSSTDT